METIRKNLKFTKEKEKGFINNMSIETSNFLESVGIDKLALFWNRTIVETMKENEKNTFKN